MSLFSKKPIIGVDYDHVLEPELLDFLERMEDLERQAKSISNEIELKALEWHSNVSQYKREVSFSKEQAKELKIRTHTLKENFINLVNEFRNKAPEEDFQKVKKKIDSWQLEEYITTDEFIRLMKERSQRSFQ